MSVLESIQQVAQHAMGEAEALPFGSYHSPEVYAAEQQKLFSRDWVFACFEANVPNPGDYHALKIAGESIVVIRGKDGELRALSNVCRHRGAVMLKGSGNANAGKLVCPYHAWTYSSQGELKGVPYSGSVEVDKKAHCLPQFKLESWFGLVFVSLNDDAPPLAERYKGMEKYFSKYQVDSFKHTESIKVEYWQANWKLAIENFVEGYHFFAVHKKTVEPGASTKDNYYVEGHADWSITGGKQLDYPSTIKGWIKGKPEEIHYLSICLPPNFVCNLYEGYMTWARVLPTGPTTCEIATGYVSYHSFKASKWSKAFNDKIFAEDREVSERVQEGVTSQISKGGKLVELERAVVDFHHYLAKFLFDKDYGRLYQTEHASHFKETR